MSINYNPKIVTDGLLTCLDAGNTKSFDPYENLFTYSETFTSPSLWSLLDCAASKNAVDPNGVNNSATTITRNSTAYGGLYVYQPSNGFAVTSGVAYTFSIFLKAGTASSIFVSLETSGTGGAVFSYSGIGINLATGTITSGSGGTIVAYPNGWYRVSITETATATGTAEPGIYSSGTTAFPLNGTMFIWGAQFERASSASRYYATTGTAKNRGTSLTDISGNGIVGTLTNGPTYNALNNGSIIFDGVNDRISTGNVDLSATNKISVCFWCKILAYTETAGTSKIIFETTNNFNSSALGFIAGYADDSNSLYLNTFPISLALKGNNGYNISGFNKTLVNDLQWHYWCCIFDKSLGSADGVQETILYIDGIERTPSVVPSNIYRVNNTNNFGSAPLHIGQRTGNIAPSNIQVSNFQIYNKVLSSAEILQNYNATRGRFGI